VEQPPEHVEDELVQHELNHAEKKRRTGRARIVGGAVSVVIIGVVFAYLLPKIADYAQVWDVVKALSWGWIVALVVVTIANVLSNAPPWMAALPGIGFLYALRVTCASSALSLVAPGGTAVAVATQFGMLKSWGFQGRPVGLAVALTNIWGQLITYGFPVIAIAALTAEGGRNSTLDWVALIGLAVFIAIVAGFAVGLSSKRLAKKVGDKAARVVSWLKHLIHKRPVRWSGDEFVRFRAEAIVLLRRRWHVLTIAMIASQLAVFLVLVVTLRAVGVGPKEVDVVEAFAAWTLIRALGSIPITPGGFGIEELALTGALVGFGASNPQAVAATLIYRFLTVVPTLVVGLAAAATYKVGKPKAAEAAAAG
jgi:putative heme transporter